MKNARSLTSVPETMDRIPEIHQAFDIANQARLTREELEDLDRREQFIYDQQGAIIKAVQEGIEQGREEGMREKAIAIAQQLLSRLDDRTISETTGLSVEDVRNLRSMPS
jgi:predicted transposase/invertase (TIGR01784 family)